MKADMLGAANPPRFKKRGAIAHASMRDALAANRQEGFAAFGTSGNPP
jgi:hypothetical protein